ncbi:activating signal cointegrator 1 complex subunit 2 [Biomphalaria glabrata]|nr:activating signal cointegrator 1 complex subunit 2 [Biomphalaria glabrata]
MAVVDVTAGGNDSSRRKDRNYSRRSQLKLHYYTQALLSALTTGQDKRGLNVVPELAITGQREHIGEHDVTLIT